MEAKSNQNDMTMSFTDRFGQPQEITINAVKVGDDIEELATYIVYCKRIWSQLSG
ncbi:hypothetical protein OK016_04415 [Vibrio chagasii]|nr:hypothetical protein [Vibrio chagasii]